MPEAILFVGWLGIPDCGSAADVTGSPIEIQIQKGGLLCQYLNLAALPQGTSQQWCAAKVQPLWQTSANSTCRGSWNLGSSSAQALGPKPVGARQASVSDHD